MKKEDLNKFKEQLLELRRQLLSDYNHMADEALKQNHQDNLSNIPIHMADMGTDNYEQEFTLNLMEGEREELREIDAALKLIEDGGYGVCLNCEKKIPNTRLKAVPYAKLCIECKRKEELASGM